MNNDKMTSTERLGATLSAIADVRIDSQYPSMVLEPAPGQSFPHGARLAIKEALEASIPNDDITRVHRHHTSQGKLFDVLDDGRSLTLTTHDMTHTERREGPSFYDKDKEMEALARLTTALVQLGVPPEKLAPVFANPEMASAAQRLIETGDDRQAAQDMNAVFDQELSPEVKRIIAEEQRANAKQDSSQMNAIIGPSLSTTEQAAADKENLAVLAEKFGQSKFTIMAKHGTPDKPVAGYSVRLNTDHTALAKSDVRQLSGILTRLTGQECHIGTSGNGYDYVEVKATSLDEARGILKSLDTLDLPVHQTKRPDRGMDGAARQGRG